MRLIIVLRFFVRESNRERDLISLFHDGTMAFRHFANVKMKDAGDGFQILLNAGEQFVRCVRVLRIRPENNNV